MKQKLKKQTTLYDIIKKQTAKEFNYPLSMACDGDIIAYLKNIKL